MNPANPIQSWIIIFAFALVSFISGVSVKANNDAIGVNGNRIEILSKRIMGIEGDVRIVEQDVKRFCK